MKKTIQFFLSISFFWLAFSCQQKPEKEDIQLLNGYWEIKEVTQKDGTKRGYKFNETVDFISLDSTGKGFRKKVMPQLDGTYKTFADREQLEAKMKNDSLYLYYTTDLANWKEEVILIEKDKFSVKNKRGIQYTYQRFNGYLDDGKK
ncbi:hypothetical protein [Mesonia aquimarina]|uniref:hypothetical protein n=1 Tax=Mesonia aquimarina TaxID=1504967 RepID=UPI000EF5C1E0|nr:hypothetical protein [Mesonia aquimarina]